MGIFDKVLKKTKEGWFKKVTTLFERTTTADVLSDDLEELLIAADVGVDTATKLIDQVKTRTKSEKLSGNSQIYAALKQEMTGILNVPMSPSHRETSAAGPLVILIVGVNGTGKTLTVAKLANIYRKKGKKVVIAAALRNAAAAHATPRDYLVRAGKELAALLVNDTGRLNSILKKVKA